MSTIKTETLSTPSNATVPVDTVVNGTAKAWVNFNGTGTVAIRRAFNVASITDIGTGDYIVNFTTAMVDANFSAVASCKFNETGTSWRIPTAFDAHTTSSCRWMCILSINGTAEDMTTVSVTVFS
jgi:hypothetical protein